MGTGHIQITALEFGTPVEALQTRGASLQAPDLAEDIALLLQQPSSQSVWIVNSASEEFYLLLNSGAPITIPGANTSDWLPSATAVSWTLNGPESQKFGEGRNMFMLWRRQGPAVAFAAQIQIQSIGAWASPRVIFIASMSPVSVQAHILSGGVLMVESILPMVLPSGV